MPGGLSETLESCVIACITRTGFHIPLMVPYCMSFEASRRVPLSLSLWQEALIPAYSRMGSRSRRGKRMCGTQPASSTPHSPIFRLEACADSDRRISTKMASRRAAKLAENRGSGIGGDAKQATTQVWPPRILNSTSDISFDIESTSEIQERRLSHVVYRMHGPAHDPSLHATISSDSGES